MRSGLFVGEMKKKRFEPSQSLAMALRAKDYKNCLRLSVNDERVVRYLKGETLVLTDEEAAAKDGWQLVCVEDYPLGWGKKNKHNLKINTTADGAWYKRASEKDHISGPFLGNRELNYI